MNENVTKIDRIRGFLYLENLFYKIVLLFGTINAIARRPFFHRLYNDEPILLQDNAYNIVLATWNCFKATLQLVYCAIVGYGLWKYLCLLMYTFDYDLLSAIAGPFLIHPMLAYHLIREVRITDPYRGTNFDLGRIMKCYGAWLYCFGNWTILPILRAIRAVFKFIVQNGIVKSIKAIKKGMFLALKTYEMTLVFPTILLVKKGVILELVHLIYTLVWIMWPLAFIWGYLSMGENFTLLTSFSYFKILYNNPVVDLIKGKFYQFIGKWIILVYDFILKEVAAAYSFLVGNFLVTKIFALFSFIKRIWVIGHIIRLILWIVGKLFSSLWRMVIGFFGLRMLFAFIFRSLMSNGEEGKDGIPETGGSLLPKVTLSVIILAFKITRAMKIIKSRQ